MSKELKYFDVSINNINPDVNMTSSWKHNSKNSYIGFIKFNNWKCEQQKEIDVLKTEEEKRKANESFWYNLFSWKN